MVLTVKQDDKAALGLHYNILQYWYIAYFDCLWFSGYIIVILYLYLPILAVLYTHTYHNTQLFVCNIYLHLQLSLVSAPIYFSSSLAYITVQLQRNVPPSTLPQNPNVWCTRITQSYLGTNTHAHRHTSIYLTDGTSQHANSHIMSNIIIRVIVIVRDD